MTRLAAFLLALMIANSAQAEAQAEAPKRLSATVQGVMILAYEPGAAEIDGIRTTPARQALTLLSDALSQVMTRSPLVAARIERLKQAGRPIVLYDARHPKDTATEITLGAFYPDFYDPKAGKKDFVIVFGRTGIQWGPQEIAATLAHELGGHAIQRLEGRIYAMRLLDAECEANLIEEQAKQDLGFDKHSQASVAARRDMETHWCDDFRRWTIDSKSPAAPQWDALNPNVPTLLRAFRGYLEKLAG